ncbi:MAG: tetratricopeptide repeat protein [Pseudobdellovibrio sp.]
MDFESFNGEQFIEKYGKHIFIGVGIVIVAALVATLISYSSTNKEKQAQDKFYALDAKVQKFREDKLKASAPQADKKEDVAQVKIDVNQLKSELNQFASEYQGTVAGQMASLQLSQILSDEGNPGEALTLLQKAETKSDSLANTLVRMKIAQLFSDQDKCQDAITLWGKIISSKSASFVHAEAKLNQALCYKKLNELAKAEEILNQVRNEKSEESVDASREAERILRLIQFNKAIGT